MTLHEFSTLLNQRWLIEPQALDKLLATFAIGLTNIKAETIIQVLNVGKTATPPPIKAFSHNVVGKSYQMQSLSKSEEDTVAIIPVEGIVTEYGWNSGTLYIAKLLKEAQKTDNIVSVLLYFNTPGGAANASYHLVPKINAFTKPKIGFVKDYCFSAGMKLISCCDEIVAESPISEVGSIGTMCTFQDFSGIWEKLGAKTYDVYATLATDKNGAYRQLIEGNDELVRTGLDFFNTIFHTTMKTNRPHLSEDTLTGKTYFAEEAITKGLIDRIASLEDTLNYTLEKGLIHKINHK